MTDERDVPITLKVMQKRVFGNKLLALFPALYMGQVHGWLSSVPAYFIALVPLVAVDWMMLFGRIRPGFATAVRLVFLVVTWALIALSGGTLAGLIRAWVSSWAG